MQNNSMNVFLETGVTNNKIKTFVDNWKVCQNNAVEKEKNWQYIHNGKGTAIIKDIKTKTQKASDKFNNEKQVLTRLLLKDNNNIEYRYAIGAIHAKNGKHKAKWSQTLNQL